MSAIEEMIKHKNQNLNCSPVTLQELWYIDDLLCKECSYIESDWFLDAVRTAFKKMNPDGRLTKQLREDIGEKELQRLKIV